MSIFPFVRGTESKLVNHAQQPGAKSGWQKNKQNFTMQYLTKQYGTKRNTEKGEGTFTIQYSNYCHRYYCSAVPLDWSVETEGACVQLRRESAFGQRGPAECNRLKLMIMKIDIYENVRAYPRRVVLLLRWALLAHEGVTWAGPEARKVGQRADGKRKPFSLLVHCRRHVVSAAKRVVVL